MGDRDGKRATGSEGPAGVADPGTPTGEAADGTSAGEAAGGPAPEEATDGTSAGRAAGGPAPEEATDGTSAGRAAGGADPGETAGGTDPGEAADGADPGETTAGADTGAAPGGTTSADTAGETAAGDGGTGETATAPRTDVELPRDLDPARWDRPRVEAVLERVVYDRRFEIAVVFPATGAALLLASAQGWVGPPLRFNAALVLFGTFVMRLPLVAGVAPLLDRRATFSLVALTAYAYGIEYVGTTTGWPYGPFTYGVDLGPMIAGKVPLGLPVFFFPLVLNSYLLVLLLAGDRARSRAVRLGATLATVLAVDLVLDPGAVAIGFWAYDLDGVGAVYYGVPWTNYRGWVLSGTVAVVAFDVAFDYEALRERLRSTAFMLDDLVSFVVLWGSINAFYGQWVPVAVAAALGAGLVYTDRFDAALLRGRTRGLRRLRRALSR